MESWPSVLQLLPKRMDDDAASIIRVGLSGGYEQNRINLPQSQVVSKPLTQVKVKLRKTSFWKCGDFGLFALRNQLQKFDTLLVKSRFPRPGLLMNSRTYLSF